MKTLKKALCLVLALVMVVGTLAIAASADVTYTDKDAIEYDKAAGVMNGIGALQGNPDGSFNPTGTLSRAEGATIVARVVLGAKAADNIPKMDTQFDDVKASNWFSGYVSWASSEDKQIIVGKNPTTFDPNGKLTGYEFAKMLLVATGTPASEFASNWKINTYLKASEAGLLKDIEDIELDAPITRDEAAQMAYSSLYVGGTESSAFVVKQGDVTLYEGTDALQALVYKSMAGAEITTSKTTAGALAGDKYGIVENNTVDAFGRSSKETTNGKSGDDKVVYFKEDSTPVKTYTEETTYGKILKDLGLKDATFTLNDNSATATPIGAKNEKDTTAIGGQGVLLEVYKTADKAYQIVKVDTYATKLAESAIHAAKGETKAYIDIAGTTYETDAFKKDEVVLYTIDDKGVVQNVLKANVVNGSVSATNKTKGTVSVAGKTYKVSAHNAAAPVVGTTDGYKYSTDVWAYYLDSYDNVIYAEKGAAAEGPKANYIYVVRTQAQAGEDATTGDLIDAGKAGKDAIAKAQVISIDGGNAQVKDIAIVKGTDNKFYYATSTGAASSTEVTTAGTKVNAVCEYWEVNGKLVLGEAASLKSVTVKKDQATVTGVSELANSKTVLKVYTVTKDEKTALATSATLESKTGIANFDKDGKTFDALVSTKDNAITEIFAVTDYVKPEEKVTASYAVYRGEGDTTADGTAYMFKVDGKETQFIADKDFDASALVENGVYTYEVKNNKLTKVEAKTASVTKQNVTMVDDTFVQAGSVVYFADGYKVVDAREEYKLLDKVPTDVSVSIFTDKDGKAEFIVVDAKVVAE